MNKFKKSAFFRKYRVVLEEINMSSSALLQPLKMLANYLAQPGKREAIIADLDTQVGHNASSSDPYQ